MALVINNPPGNAGDIRDVGSVPWSGGFPGEGHGNPLQYSCLENPMDRGAWGIIVHGVAKSQTWLRWLHTAQHTWSHYLKQKTNPTSVWNEGLEHQSIKRRKTWPYRVWCRRQEKWRTPCGIQEEKIILLEYKLVDCILLSPWGKREVFWRNLREAEHRRIDAFELWCWRRLLRVPWTARRSN